MAPSPENPNKGLGDCRGSGHSGRPPSSLALGAPAPGCAHPQEGLRTRSRSCPGGIMLITELPEMVPSSGLQVACGECIRVNRGNVHELWGLWF